MENGVRICVVEQRQGRIWAENLQKLSIKNVKRPGNQRLFGCSGREELLRKGQLCRILRILVQAYRSAIGLGWWRNIMKHVEDPLVDYLSLRWDTILLKEG